MQYLARSEFINTQDRCRLHFQDWGSGQPLVLLHGWPLSAEMWEYQARFLVEQGYRVISYDRRGFGRSSKPFSGYSYDQLAADLNDVILELDLREAVLIGFSMGAGEIARYLKTFGASRVSKTVLISSILPYLLKEDDNPNGIAAKTFNDMIDALKNDRPAFLEGFTREFYGEGVLKSPASDGILRWTQSLALAASPKATIDCVTAFGTTDFRADLNSFTMPTLIVHGSADKIVPISNSCEVTARAIPTSLLKVYDGAPHGLFVTHKERLQQDVLRFLGSDKVSKLELSLEEASEELFIFV